VIALSISKDVFDKDEIYSSLKYVKKYLLTPYGLRTLAPFEKGFKEIYTGKLKKRDSAYHQGTVWPFLFQFYYDIVKPNFYELESRFLKLLKKTNLLFPEIFDATYPYREKGAIHQAWTVAGLLYIMFKYGKIQKL